jgi:hypothetical protein
MLHTLPVCFAGSLAPFHHRKKRRAINLKLSIGPLESVIAGILILAMPRLLNYIVELT